MDASAVRTDVVRRVLLWAPLLAMVVGTPAAAGTGGPVLHEPIPPDPREDLAMHVALDGDLPAAIQTRSGIVSAPDPRAPTSPADSAYGAADPATFQPDRDTKLTSIDASHLFAASTTRLALRRGIYLRGYVYDFITLFAPQFNRAAIEAALKGDAESYEL